MALPREESGYKLFVGGLPEDCSPEELTMVFSTYGPLERVHMMPPRSKSGLRCAFVFYTKLESAEDAIKVLDGIYRIREDAEAPIQVKWPREDRGLDFPRGESKGSDWGKGEPKGGADWGKGEPRGYDWGKGGFKGGSGEGFKGGCSEGPKLFVGSLPHDCTEQDVSLVFNTYGEVKHIHLMQPHALTGMRCCFVTYDRHESAEDAIKVLDGQYKIRENAEGPIVVRYANERRSSKDKGKDKGWGKGKGKDDWGWGDGKGSWPRGGNWGWQDGGGGGGWGGCDGGWGLSKGWWDDDWMKGGKKGKGKGDFKGAKGDWWDGKGKKGFKGGGMPDEMDAGMAGMAGMEEGPAHRVHVSNLPEDIQQNAMEYVFGTYGKVEKVHIMTEEATNGGVAAFVDFGSAEDAETAIASLHEKYEIRPGYGPLIVRHASAGPGRSMPY